MGERPAARKNWAFSYPKRVHVALRLQAGHRDVLLAARNVGPGHWSRVATSYDGSGGEPDEIRLRRVLWIVRFLAGAFRGSRNSEMYRRGRKRDLFRCTLSAHGKEGYRRHTGQHERPGSQLHQSAKKPRPDPRGPSAGIFRAACLAPTRTDTIHSRSDGTARAHLLRALTKSVFWQISILVGSGRLGTSSCARRAADELNAFLAAECLEHGGTKVAGPRQNTFHWKLLWCRTRCPAAHGVSLKDRMRRIRKL